jgi:hypothetical protein
MDTSTDETRRQEFAKAFNWYEYENEYGYSSINLNI